jgi:hypothetical protein
MVNGAKNYSQWEQQEQLLREQLRILVNAPVVTDIALLKNTSEALSLVAYGLTWQKNDNIVIPNRLNRRLTQISPISPLSVFQIGVDTLITPLDSAAKSAWDKVDCRKQG